MGKHIIIFRSITYEPKLVIKTYDEDIKAVTYWGLGYKVVRYISESLDEPYASNVGVNHNGKVAHITQEDMDTILKIIKCY